MRYPSHPDTQALTRLLPAIDTALARPSVRLGTHFHQSGERQRGQEPRSEAALLHTVGKPLPLPGHSMRSLQGSLVGSGHPHSLSSAVPLCTEREDLHSTPCPVLSGQGEHCPRYRTLRLTQCFSCYLIDAFRGVMNTLCKTTQTCAHSTAHAWRSQDKFQELGSLFYPVGSGAQTQFLRPRRSHQHQVPSPMRIQRITSMKGTDTQWARSVVFLAELTRIWLLLSASQEAALGKSQRESKALPQEL